MSIFKDLNEIVRACYPKDQDEALDLWHAIKPVRFYNDVNWTVATEYVLARYSIPDDAAYLVVTRVETWIITNVAAAPGYGLRIPPPPGAVFNTRWLASPDGTVLTPDVNVTGEELPTGLLNVDEFLFFKAGNVISLIADLPANPDANAKTIQTVVYSYLCGTKVADKLGSGEIIIGIF
jgi:hypothetical protein